MSLDDNKAMSREVLAMWGAGSSKTAEEILAPDYVNHQMPDVEGSVSSKSLEEWKSLVADFKRGFPDSQCEILVQVAEGNYVASRWQLTGTHTGDFRDMKATGKRATWTGVHTDRFADGKMVESWVEWDKYRFLDELGQLG
ncbi:MAG: ester cyclase [Pirellulales bacterium]|nr:ester cyclase [Pirellulales bacterium]